jgi:hypothetical protein
MENNESWHYLHFHIINYLDIKNFSLLKNKILICINWFNNFNKSCAKVFFFFLTSTYIALI